MLNPPQFPGVRTHPARYSTRHYFPVRDSQGSVSCLRSELVSGSPDLLKAQLKLIQLKMYGCSICWSLFAIGLISKILTAIQMENKLGFSVSIMWLPKDASFES